MPVKVLGSPSPTQVVCITYIRLAKRPIGKEMEPWTFSRRPRVDDTYDRSLWPHQILWLSACHSECHLSRGEGRDPGLSWPEWGGQKHDHAYPGGLSGPIRGERTRSRIRCL